MCWEGVAQGEGGVDWKYRGSPGVLCGPSWLWAGVGNWAWALWSPYLSEAVLRMYWSLVAGHFPTVPMVPALGAHAYFFSLGLPLLQFCCIKWLPELLVGFYLCPEPREVTTLRWNVWVRLFWSIRISFDFSWVEIKCLKFLSFSLAGLQLGILSVCRNCRKPAGWLQTRVKARAPWPFIKWLWLAVEGLASRPWHFSSCMMR